MVHCCHMSRRSDKGGAFAELVIEVFRLNGQLLQAGDELAKPVGLTSSRWQVLGVVEHAPASVAHVAREMGLSRQSVQRTADLLAEDGLVEYADNPHHRRAKLVQMTPRGREALDYVKRRQADWTDRIGGEHGLEDLRTAVTVLRRARESLERDAPPPAFSGGGPDPSAPRYRKIGRES
jgi:DNA-binding MarR family transcriptional regulator